MSDAIPFDSLAADPDPDRAIRRWDRGTRAASAPDRDPDPERAIRRPDRAAGAPDPDPDPGPPSGAPSHLLSYELSKLLHAPHSRFRQIFNNGQDFRHAHVTYDETGHPGRCAKNTENHIAG